MEIHEGHDSTAIYGKSLMTSQVSTTDLIIINIKLSIDNDYQ